jgi:hypothetical protein
MPTNNRIYWACQGVGISPQDSISFVGVHGLQSVGITTTFNLEQVFEIGQLSIYENIEDITDIEVTMEKVLDGHPLLYHLATKPLIGSSTNGRSLAARANPKCNVALNIYDDTYEAASGNPQAEVIMSGMYVSSVSYTFPVEGNCTESLTLVGNNKAWRTSGYLMTGTILGGTVGQDTPRLPAVSGGVQRRENILWVGPAGHYTRLPSEVEGISTSGTNDQVAGVNNAHVQSLSVSVDLGREALNELGRKGPYFRFVNFPVEVSTEIEVTSSRGDRINATEEGLGGGSGNLVDQTIFIATSDGTRIDLGSRNKLASVSYGGADAGGGNATVTYSYSTFNDFSVTHPSDNG